MITDQLLTGLGYAHGRKVIHRDIKPANIFLSKDGVVKLGDFGLARVMRELAIRKTEIRGTPLYMAPEQVTGTNIDHRADLYAVGCTLFELVTGRPPFLDGDILYHHLHTAPPVPSAYDPSIPAELDAVIVRCIAKKAEDRYPDAQAIRQALAAVLR
jgi:serine/threonine protein kinase